MPVRTEVLMGTFVTIETVAHTSAGATYEAVEAETVDRAFGWFRSVEACCTRFDPGSELMELCARPGAAVPVSLMLFELVSFAIRIAEETGGAFDPTVGARMAARGFNREHRTGRRMAPALADDPDVSFRDVEVDRARLAVTLRRPLTLDLGAVAKGFAVDAAARELRGTANFAIDAGGDLYLAGHNAAGGAWSVGIRHPRRDGELLESIRVSDRAVCTSGSYERRGHLLDPRSGADPPSVASVTVVAPHAMLADALATAAFVLGPEDGLSLLARHGVAGLIVTADLERHATPDFGRG
jgi:thiamine biosynthesis lipoprotein